jgi:hypothetical protein
MADGQLLWALFLLITHRMSAIGVARSQQDVRDPNRQNFFAGRELKPMC